MTGYELETKNEGPGEQAATKNDVAELKMFIKSALAGEQALRVEHNQALSSLLSIYDSLCDQYYWIQDALSELTGTPKNHRLRLLHKDCAIALAKEIIDVLSRYGVRPFRETGKFNPRRHMAVTTVPTDRADLHHHIRRVNRVGFLKKTGDEDAIFRPQQVTVYIHSG